MAINKLHTEDEINFKCIFMTAYVKQQKTDRQTQRKAHSAIMYYYGKKKPYIFRFQY